MSLNGYRRIVQYGDTVEYYEYEKKIHQKPPSKLKAQKLTIQESIRDNGVVPSFIKNNKRNKQKRARQEQIEKGTYFRSKQSIRRSKLNFYRLAHHNIINSKTVHFLTLTFAYDVDKTKAQTYLKRTMGNIQKSYSEISIRYISVPEQTKKGRLHFHLLVFDLPPETSKNERTTRNIQRSFHRGYIDIRYASYTSKGIAGYMAKYMAKSFSNETTKTHRGYTTSRNIIKYYEAGSNSLLDETYIPFSDEISDTQITNYQVPYLGNCKLTKIIKKQS